MTRIAVVGGTGYAGKNIVAEAKARGYDVTSISRSAPEQPIDGVTIATADLRDAAAVAQAADGADVVVFATAPRGDMAGVTRSALKAAIAALPKNVRVGVVGGAGGSLVAAGGERVVDQPGFTPEYKPEALEMIGVLEDLQADSSGHDWFYIHPAGGFGPWNDHERRGSYRDGGDVLVVDAESNIGGADFGLAVVDEIASPKHHSERFTVGY